MSVDVREAFGAIGWKDSIFDTSGTDAVKLPHFEGQDLGRFCYFQEKGEEGFRSKHDF